MMQKCAAVLLALTLLVACSERNRREHLLPGATGKPGEVVIVADAGHLGGPIDRALRTYIAQPQAGLPQDEPLLDAIGVPRQAFKSVLERHRNVISVAVDTAVRRSQLVFWRNRWASPQLCAILRAPSDSAMLRLIDSVQASLVKTFLAEERLRNQALYARYRNTAVSRRLRSRLGIDMTVPQGYVIDVIDSSFVWMSHESSDMSQAVIVYIEPFRDMAQLSGQAISAYRDSVFAQRVPGPLKGTFMQTELRMYEPEMWTHSLMDKHYTAEMRGLWRVENDYMGGPFVSYSVLDAAHGRIIHLYGYVYAPQHAKRNYVRQIDAILRSFRFAEQQKTDTQ